MTFAQFLGLLTMIAGVAMAAYRLARPSITNVRLLTTMDVAYKLVAAAVSSAEQITVKPLKDPTKPGTWTSTAAAVVKQGVIASVANTAPKVIDDLRKGGIEHPRELLGDFVEQEVLKQRAAQTPPAMAVSALPVSVVQGGNEP